MNMIHEIEKQQMKEQIPIFQVGIELENALESTNEILTQILDAVSGGPTGAAPTADEEAGQLLNGTSATLI